MKQDLKAKPKSSYIAVLDQDVFPDIKLDLVNTPKIHLKDVFYMYNTCTETLINTDFLKVYNSTAPAILSTLIPLTFHIQKSPCWVSQMLHAF